MGEQIYDDGFVFDGSRSAMTNMITRFADEELRYAVGESYGVAVFNGQRELLGHKLLVESGKHLFDDAFDEAAEFARRLGAKNVIITHSHLQREGEDRVESNLGDEQLSMAANVKFLELKLHFRGLLIFDPNTKKAVLLIAQMLPLSDPDLTASQLVGLPNKISDKIIQRMTAELHLSPEMQERLRNIDANSDDSTALLEVMDEMLPALRASRGAGDPDVDMLTKTVALIRSLHTMRQAAKDGLAQIEGEAPGLRFTTTPASTTPQLGAGQKVESPYKLPRFMRPPGSDKVQ